jgi:hypothetical protein
MDATRTRGMRQQCRTPRQEFQDGTCAPRLSRRPDVHRDGLFDTVLVVLVERTSAASTCGCRGERVRGSVHVHVVLQDLHLVLQRVDVELRSGTVRSSPTSLMSVWVGRPETRSGAVGTDRGPTARRDDTDEIVPDPMVVDRFRHRRRRGRSPTARREQGRVVSGQSWGWSRGSGARMHRRGSW